MPAPLIISDGGPYRTPAGPVVDRLAERLDCPVIQLGTGTVRADEDTVERAVTEVGSARLLISVGAGTLTDIAKVTAQRTGSRHVAVQTACSINGFIADRSVLVIAGAKRTVVSRWPDMLIADSDILTAAPVGLNLAGVGDLSTVPNAVAEWQLAAGLGHGPAYDAAVVEQVLAAMPALPSLAAAARDSEPAGLADLARLLAGSGLSMGIVGSTAPASGSEHAVSHLLEMALSQREGPAAPHGMQVTVATRLALRVWQLVDSSISSGAQIRMPDESSRRQATESAFAELGAKTVEECWTGYSRQARLAARTPGRRRGDGRRLGRVQTTRDAADSGTVRRSEPRERAADAGQPTSAPDTTTACCSGHCAIPTYCGNEFRS